MRSAAQVYAGSAFKHFFSLSVTRTVSQSARLRDLAEHLEGISVKGQGALLQLVAEAEARERPAQLDNAAEAFRRHNSSFPQLQGQCVYGKVIKAERKFVWVDVGIRNYTRVAKKELNFSQLVASRGTGGQRLGGNDFRIGDVLTFFIEDLETPFGDILLRSTGQASQNLDRNAVWAIFEQHLHDQTPIKGRVLNGVQGGYAIGVAGAVAFCPFNCCSVLTANRIGILQPFLIQTLSEDRRSLVVEDYRLKVRLPAQTDWRQGRRLAASDLESEV